VGLRDLVAAPLETLEDVEGRSRDLLLEAVLAMQYCRTGNICMLATTQNIPDILCRFPSDARFDFQARNEDIHHYLTVRMPELASCVRRNEALQREITSQILASVDGMYVMYQNQINWRKC